MAVTSRKRSSKPVWDLIVKYWAYEAESCFSYPMLCVSQSEVLALALGWGGVALGGVASGGEILNISGTNVRSSGVGLGKLLSIRIVDSIIDNQKLSSSENQVCGYLSCMKSCD